MNGGSTDDAAGAAAPVAARRPPPARKPPPIRAAPAVHTATHVQDPTPPATVAWFNGQSRQTRLGFLNLLIEACSEDEARAVRSFAAARAPGSRSGVPRDRTIAESASDVDAAIPPRFVLALLEDLESSATAVDAITDLISSPDWNQTTRTAGVVLDTIMIHPAFPVATRHAIVTSIEANRVAAVKKAQELAQPGLALQSVYPTSATPCKIPVEDDPRKPGVAFTFAFVVYWSDGAEGKVLRSYSDFFSFHCKLLDLFPEDAEREPREIPYLPGKKMLSLKKARAVAMERVQPIMEYLPLLFALEPRISQCEHVVQFFRHCPRCRCLLSECTPNCTTAGVGGKGVKPRISVKRFARGSNKESGETTPVASPRPVSLHEQQMDMFFNPLHTKASPSAPATIAEDEEHADGDEPLPPNPLDPVEAVGGIASPPNPNGVSTISEFVEMEQRDIPGGESGDRTSKA
eukprot:m.83572 g.83572  ORF g.83572 m.83572 type:complete len:462 (+) comp11219_c0_seq2:89-1474(+)